MSEGTGGGPEFGPREEQIVDRNIKNETDTNFRRIVIENRDVASFYYQAEAELTELDRRRTHSGKIAESDENNLKTDRAGAGHRASKGYFKSGIEALESYANQPPIINPEQVLKEANKLTIADEATAAVILSFAEIPDFIRDRLDKDPASEITSEELTGIYKSVTERLTQEPGEATFEDLMLIVQAELAQIEKQYAETLDAKKTVGTFNDPGMVKLNSLSKCEDGLRKLIKKEEITATSEEGEALIDYLDKKVTTFVNLRRQTEGDNDEHFALAETNIAFFGALYDQLPD